jgi:glycosyltransferase involved in cell wall biosynthesis
VLIPCFNEAAILSQTVALLTSYLDKDCWKLGLTGNWEILIVDEGSTDDTRAILADAGLSKVFRMNQTIL